jgi:DNA-binding NarL/FixJ family response regulator
MPVRILIVDDDETIRGLVRRIVQEHPGWSVCGEASNGFEALAQINQSTPDVVVMDLAMPRMNGIQAAHEISRMHPDLPMLLLTVQQIEKALVYEARRAGSEVVKGIEALLRKETFFWAADPVPAA